MPEPMPTVTARRRRCLRPAMLLAAACAMMLGFGSPAHAVSPTSILLALERPDAQPPISVRGSMEEALRTFYGEEQRGPIWTDDAGLTPRARALVRVLLQADREGLDPRAYLPEKLEQHLGMLPAEERPAAELALSAAYLRYARDMRTGVTPHRIKDDEIALPRKSFDALEELAAVAAAPDIADHMAGLVPPHEQYAQLRRALAAYRAVEAKGEWPSVEPGPTMRPGEEHTRILDVRRNLEAKGYPVRVDVENPEYYDESLERQVVRFQKLHGLDTDAAIGPKTLSAMNHSVHGRVRQIEVNMDRWRMLPDDLGDRYILVNQAGFDLAVFEDDEEVMEMRVVVGTAYRRTPVFKGTMTYMDVNPTWTVPPSIAGKDILPKVREDPAYLHYQGFTVFADWKADAPVLDPWSIDWHAIHPDRFPFKLQQAPGPLNSLGQIKFMFPNEFAVYLHDTPSRSLFRRAERTGSSGCIRIEKPMMLAEYLIKDDPNWTPERLGSTLESARTRTIPLQRSIPVYLLYKTAWVDKDGIVQFRDDIYGRDGRAIQAMGRS